MMLNLRTAFVDSINGDFSIKESKMNEALFLNDVEEPALLNKRLADRLMLPSSMISFRSYRKVF